MRDWDPRSGLIDIVTAWLIIGFQEHVARRHKRSKARRDGWHVLLLSFGGGVLKDMVITPHDLHNWKRLF